MSSETMIVSGVAGRYAAALFDLALSKDCLDAVAGDLAGLRAKMAESADLAALVKSPTVGREAQSRAVLAIAEKAKLDPLTQSFLGVVARNRRLGQLIAISVAFGRLLAAHRGEISADVSSAQPLSEKQLDALKASLKKATKRDVTITAGVDPRLLGGLVVKVGSRMIDDSLRTKLNNLTDFMKGIG